MIITTYSVFLLHRSLFFTRDCSNSLLGFLDLSLLTNLFIFPLPRPSYAAPASNCQGWCFIPTTEHRSPTHLWCDAAAVRVQTLLFTFALLDSFFPSSLIYHPLPTPFHPPQGLLMRKLLRAQNKLPPVPTAPTPQSLGTKQPPQHPTHTDLHKHHPQPREVGALPIDNICDCFQAAMSQ